MWTSGRQCLLVTSCRWHTLSEQAITSQSKIIKWVLPSTPQFVIQLWIHFLVTTSAATYSFHIMYFCEHIKVMNCIVLGLLHLADMVLLGTCFLQELARFNLFVNTFTYNFSHIAFGFLVHLLFHWFTQIFLWLPDLLTACVLTGVKYHWQLLVHVSVGTNIKMEGNLGFCRWCTCIHRLVWTTSQSGWYTMSLCSRAVTSFAL
jgi:hypothetical protein